MALDDYRRWLDVQAQDGRQGSVALEVTTEGRLTLRTMGRARPDGSGFHEGEAVELDYSDAGQLLDWIREALGILLARQGDARAAAAVLGLQAVRDTPQAVR